MSLNALKQKKKKEEKCMANLVNITKKGQKNIIVNNSSNLK